MSDNIWRTDCLNLGHQGENGARELKVYVTDWLEEYPTATIRLQILRPGEDVPYYAEGVTVDGGVLTWIPSSADTGFGGYGKAELQAVQGETIVKSAVVKTFTEPCLPGTAGEVPPSMKPWTDAIEEAIEDIDGKLDAPETAGTAGQVLKLGSDLQPVWGNGGGGGSDLPEGGSAGDVLMKTADGLEWSDDVTELKSAIGGDVTVSGTTPTITAAANTRYLCGEVSTISFTPSATGICDVIFTSGTTAAVLTIPATVKFPAGVDLTSLETSTIYEINVLDGVYGVVATWPLS